MHGLLRCYTDKQRLGICHANIFGSKTNQAAHDIERVFSRFDHTTKPVEAGVRVGAAQGFMQRRNGVKVLVAALVVEEGAMLHDLFDQGHGDVDWIRSRNSNILRGRCAKRVGGQLEYIESYTSIAIGKDGDLLQCILVNGNIQLTKAAFLVAEGALENGYNLFLAETL